ncbi:MAG: hypothetical protein K2M41_04770 [Muribaculaceae bacterium]|nr:hypothetical protein [Muribaculaceae bacterium]
MKNSTLLGVAAGIAAVTYICAFALRNYVLVDFVVVMGISGVIGLLSAVALSAVIRKWTGINNLSLCILIGGIFMTGIFASIFYTSNMLYADHDSEYTEKACVVRKYQETHYKSKRITRKTYARGEPYQEYYIELNYSNGMTRSLLIKRSIYKYIHKGDSIDIKFQRGILGIPVIKGIDGKLQKNQAPTRKLHRRNTIIDSKYKNRQI